MFSCEIKSCQCGCLKKTKKSFLKTNKFKDEMRNLFKKQRGYERYKNLYLCLCGYSEYCMQDKTKQVVYTKEHILDMSLDSKESPIWIKYAQDTLILIEDYYECIKFFNSIIVFSYPFHFRESRENKNIAKKEVNNSYNNLLSHMKTVLNKEVISLSNDIQVAEIVETIKN